MSQFPNQQLTWSVVIPTYQRETVLLQCLRFIAQQTLAPKEVIVVDASPSWTQTQFQVQQELVIQYPNIDWQYVQAHRISSAAQRNQGIALATADVLFLIDDDSFMYPDCAEEVVRLYAQDIEHKVAGIMPYLEPLPPDVVQPTPTSNHQTRFHLSHRLKEIQTTLRHLAKRLIKDDDIFIPYDFSFPKYTLPPTLNETEAHPVSMTHGARMSYRREILAQVHFEETLERYAVNEDNDVCYRASRLGMLLHALKAKICHVQTSEGRLSRFTTTALWGLNQAVLHRFHSVDLARFEQQFVKLLRRRLLTQTIKDILDRRWTLPSTRGMWFAIRHYKDILSKQPEELRHWYPQFQKILIDQDYQEKKNSYK